jgi:hypothetical protein
MALFCLAALSRNVTVFDVPISPPRRIPKWLRILPSELFMNWRGQDNVTSDTKNNVTDGRHLSAYTSSKTHKYSQYGEFSLLTFNAGIKSLRATLLAENYLL